MSNNTELEQLLNKIKTEKDTKIIPENIKKGVTIFNVQGAAEGVKQFSTVEEMNSSTGNTERDLAIVYRNEVQNATVDSKFQVATFPETVVLDNAMTHNIEVRYRAVDSSKMFNCWGNLDSSRFRMDCYTESGSIRIQYTSSDGITYTRTRLQGDSGDLGNPVDFGTEIYYEMAEMWNDAIGKFIQVGGSTFEGLFNYSPIISDEIVTFGSVKYKLPKEIINYSETVDFNNKTNGLMFRTDSYVNNRANSIMKVNNYEEINGIRHAKSGSLYFIMAGYPLTAVITATNETRIAFAGYTGGTSSGDTTYVRKVDFDENGITNTTDYPTEQLPSNFETLSVEDQRYYWDISAADDTAMKTYVSGISGDTITIPQRGSSTVTLSYVSGNEYTPPVFNTNVLKWSYAPTQLTLANPNELLPGKTGYGKNGVVIGDNSIYDNLSQEDVLTKIYGLTKTPDLDYYTGINKQADLLLTRNIVDKYKYNMVRLKKLDNFDPSNAGMVIPLNNIKISKHNLYQFSDIIPESDLAHIANSGSITLSDDGKTLGLIVLNNGNSYIIDLETHSIVKTFITRNVKLYKHKVFYATNDLTDESSSDLNYYCYDLNTRENTIVATRPIGSVKNKYICRVNTYGRIITLLTYDRDDSTRNYLNAVNATFMDCESNQTSSMPEISWTTSGNSVGSVISCAANDGVYILVYKYTVSNPVSVIKCDLNLVTSTLLRDVTLSGTNPVVDNYYTVEGIQYNNTLMYQRTSGAYYINLTNKTGGYLSNIESIDLSSNNIAMARKDDRYYPITGINSTNSYSLILDESKFIPAGYERTRMYGTEVYMCLRMYETILTLETNSIAVVSWGNIVTNKFNVTLLTIVQDDTYDYIAINIGGTNSNTGPRFIPLGNTNLSGSIS